MVITRQLATEEGIFCGVSGGATLTAALAVAREAAPGSNIVCMIPDTGERYLSTLLFDSIPTDMTDEEWAISRSTPSVRFDRPGPPPPPVPEGAIDPDAAAFVEAALSDPKQPVVMFAHQWCEFCMAVRKALNHNGVPFRAIDMDSIEYKDGDRGFKIRLALAARTRMMTVPQVFVGGELLGGSVEVVNAIKDGTLAAKLKPFGIALAPKDDRPPSMFLPNWLQPRA